MSLEKNQTTEEITSKLDRTIIHSKEFLDNCTLSIISTCVEFTFNSNFVFGGGVEYNLVDD